VVTVAVIGGIGSGKSAVTERLGARGAAVVDADVIAREVVAPGSETLERLVEAFGDEVRSDDGTLDRGALASLAFAHPAATTRMNAILHPAIGIELARQVAQARGTHDVVVVAIPLFRPEHRAQLGVDRVVCVDVAPDVALDRLVTARGLAREDAALRMAAQSTREERQAMCDEVLDNSGTIEDLDEKVDELWLRLTRPCATRRSRGSPARARPRRSRGWSSGSSDPRS
jgi:dephospho-CoA kinase